MCKVSVIIPNWNGVEYLEGCLKSVLAADTEKEVIVVDNGSTDGSKELVKERYPEVILIEFSENRGFSAAVNAGIQSARAPFVFLLNNDTVIKKDTVTRLYRAISRSPKTFSVQALMVRMDDERIVDSAGDYYCALGWAFALGKDRNTEDFERYTTKRRVFSACAGAAMYRKELFEKTGLFDEEHFAYLEDVDLGYRAKLHGYESFVIKDAVVLHKGSAASGSRYNEFKVRLSARNSIYLIYKNMPAGQILWNLPFFLAGFGIKLLFFAKKGFGRVYAEGLLSGFRLCFTKKARCHKIKFKRERLKTYINIQLLLYLNVIRRLAA